MEATHPVVGHDDVIAVRCDLVDDGGPFCSVDQAPVLRDLVEHRDVGHQIGVAGLESASGVDDLDSGSARLAKEPIGGRDQVGSLHLGVKQISEGSASPNDVVLEIDRDQCGAVGLDLLLSGDAQISSQVR